MILNLKKCSRFPILQLQGV